MADHAVVFTPDTLNQARREGSANGRQVEPRLSHISVVIPTRARHATLYRLVERLAQGSRDSQLVIVEDGPPFSEVDAVLEQNRVSGKVVRLPRASGIGAARNKGIGCSDGDLIAFIDDDCVPRQDWFAAIKAAFEVTRCTVVAGIVLPSDNCRAICSAARHYIYYDETFGDYFSQPIEVTDLQTIVPITVPYASGGNSCYRREIFERYGYFRQDLPAYIDVEMGNRLGYRDKPLLNRAMVVWHDHPDAVLSFLERSFRAGRANIQISSGNYFRLVTKVVARDLANIVFRNGRRARRMSGHDLARCWALLSASDVWHLSGAIAETMRGTMRVS